MKYIKIVVPMTRLKAIKVPLNNDFSEPRVIREYIYTHSVEKLPNQPGNY